MLYVVSNSCLMVTVALIPRLSLPLVLGLTLQQGGEHT